MGFWAPRHMKAKVSNAAPVRYRNQSTSLCRTQVGHMASLAKKSIAYTLTIVPKCKPMKSQIKGWCHRSSLKRRDCLPYLCLIPQLSKSMVQPHCCCRLTWTEINGIAAFRCVAAAEPPWNSLHSIWCPSPLPALHMFLLKDLVILEPNSSKFKTQCNLWKWKELSAVSRKFFCLVEIEQPLLVAKLKRAEINGFRAGRCVWRPPSLHEILFIPYDVHLHFLLFTCFFWNLVILEPNSSKFKTQCNLCT